MDRNYEALHVLWKANPSTMFLWRGLLWLSAFALSHLQADRDHSISAGDAQAVGALAGH